MESVGWLSGFIVNSTCFAILTKDRIVKVRGRRTQIAPKRFMIILNELNSRPHLDIDRITSKYVYVKNEFLKS